MPKFDFTLYSSTELANIGEVQEYRRLVANLLRSGAGLQAPAHLHTPLVYPIAEEGVGLGGPGFGE